VVGNKAFAVSAANEPEIQDQAGEIAANIKIRHYMSKGTEHGYKEHNPHVIYLAQPSTAADVRVWHDAYWRQAKELKSKNSEKSVTDGYIEKTLAYLHSASAAKPSFKDIFKAVLKVTKGKVRDEVAFVVIQAIMFSTDEEHTYRLFEYRMERKFSPP